MSDPVCQMLTLEGAAELYAATMELVEATEQAFGLFVQPCRLEALIADFDAETEGGLRLSRHRLAPRAARFRRRGRGARGG